ncbi:MAG: hypothetical protein PHF26_02810 [Candidatus Gracilibacteria bacterium]|nr:hypothetical protein [Candidatus Gracilibacteria bacterium]
MENGEIYVDSKGRKWILINGTYYIDDMTFEEANSNIRKYAKENAPKLFELIEKYS